MHDYTTRQLSLPHSIQIASRSAGAVAPAYIGAVVAAEAIGAFVAPLAGVAGHALLIVALLAHYVYSEGARYQRLLPALALVPILRVLSMVMPVRFLPEPFWYALIGLPLLVAVLLAAQLLALGPGELGLHARGWPRQLLIAASGLPLGLAAALLAPQLAFVSLSGAPLGMLLMLVALALMLGLAEELLFRGVLLRAADQALGPAGGLLCASLLSAAVYLGTRSIAVLALAALVGLFLGWCAQRSGGIWGAIGAHTLLNLALAALADRGRAWQASPANAQLAWYAGVALAAIVAALLALLALVAARAGHAPEHGVEPRRAELAIALSALALVVAGGAAVVLSPTLQQIAIATPAPATAVASQPTAMPRPARTAAPAGAPARPAAQPTAVPAPAAVGAATPAPAQPTAQPNASPPALPNYVEYTVQRGDILWTIAREHDVRISDILALNTIENPESLRIGQVLRIPAPASR